MIGSPTAEEALSEEALVQMTRAIGLAQERVRASRQTLAEAEAMVIRLIRERDEMAREQAKP